MLSHTLIPPLVTFYVPGANNSLCVTLRSNINLNPNSVVSISSLGYVDGSVSAPNGEIKLERICKSNSSSCDNQHESFAAYDGVIRLDQVTLA